MKVSNFFIINLLLILLSFPTSAEFDQDIIYEYWQTYPLDDTLGLDSFPSTPLSDDFYLNPTEACTIYAEANSFIVIKVTQIGENFASGRGPSPGQGEWSCQGYFIGDTNFNNIEFGRVVSTDCQHPLIAAQPEFENLCDEWQDTIKPVFDKDLEEPMKDDGDPECCGVGNPIHAATGNKFQSEIDF